MYGNTMLVWYKENQKVCFIQKKGEPGNMYDKGDLLLRIELEPIVPPLLLY